MGQKDVPRSAVLSADFAQYVQYIKYLQSKCYFKLAKNKIIGFYYIWTSRSFLYTFYYSLCQISVGARNLLSSAIMYTFFSFQSLRRSSRICTYLSSSPSWWNQGAVVTSPSEVPIPMCTQSLTPGFYPTLSTLLFLLKVTLLLFYLNVHFFY